MRRANKESMAEAIKGFDSVLGLHSGTEVFFNYPCVDCPFAKSCDSEGENKGNEILTEAQYGDDHVRVCDHRIDINGTLPEHLIKCDDVIVDGQSACIGYLAFMKKTFKRPRNDEIRKMVEGISKKALEMTMTYDEFIEKHDIKERVISLYQQHGSHFEPLKKIRIPIRPRTKKIGTKNG